ncbi:nucleoporin NUP42-like [Pithys albifrons albifrons]|uniref:nucleoporin NUP42-like n=1 Tax=Pithys albifrons albifrons TaxID=3385563 RepID=UPI003A5D02BF
MLFISGLEAQSSVNASSHHDGKFSSSSIEVQPVKLLMSSTLCHFPILGNYTDDGTVPFLGLTGCFAWFVSAFNLRSSIVSEGSVALGSRLRGAATLVLRSLRTCYRCRTSPPRSGSRTAIPGYPEGGGAGGCPVPAPGAPCGRCRRECGAGRGPAGLSAAPSGSALAGWGCGEETAESPTRPRENSPGNFPARSSEQVSRRLFRRLARRAALECYNCRAKKVVGNYLSAFKNTGTHPLPAFGLGGQQTSSFGLSSFPVSSSSASASNFSFKASSSLISSSSSGNSPAAGGSLAAGNPPAFGVTSSPSTPQSVGFGSPAAPSAASFSFKTAATTGGVGPSGFSGFGNAVAAAAANSSSPTAVPAFGAFNAAAVTSASPSSSALSGQTASASGHVTSASSAVTSTTASEKLFTPKSELSAAEWQQFEAKEFTTGKIPLKPPPLELLNAYNLLSLFRSNMF